MTAAAQASSGKACALWPEQHCLHTLVGARILDVLQIDDLNEVNFQRQQKIT